MAVRANNGDVFDFVNRRRTIMKTLYYSADDFL